MQDSLPPGICKILAANGTWAAFDVEGGGQVHTAEADFPTLNDVGSCSLVGRSEGLSGLAIFKER